MIELKKAVRRVPFSKSVYRWLRHQRMMLRLRQEFNSFSELASKTQRFALHWEDRWLCLKDRTPSTGFDHHYIYHTAWAARVVALNRPAYHVDVSSSLYFCSLVSAFVPVKFYDYRPADLHLSNLSSQRADLLALPFDDASIRSLSCMHVIEHIGLGRYGDPLDPDGDLKAMAELRRVLSADGSLLFVVPVGKPRLCFNAHRIYSPLQILDYFCDLPLLEFSAVDDQGAFRQQVEPTDFAEATFACGCFKFTKKP